jgi:hypothetical protein
MVHVMKSLKMFALPLERHITGEPLPAKELFIVRIVKTLYNTVTPRFSDRYKHRLDAIKQT